MAFAQPTFSDLEASPGRMTRHRRFPGPLDLRIPWDAWAARVEPFYPRAGGGWPPVPLRTMLRMYVAQVTFQLYRVLLSRIEQRPAEGQIEFYTPSREQLDAYARVADLCKSHERDTVIKENLEKAIRR